MADNPILVQAIRQEIQNAGGRITFARFMELALYHPQHGYYASAHPRISKEGDYFTSVSVGPLFGQILARQFLQFRDELGNPPHFRVVEFGGHRGQLRDDVLAVAPDLNYQIVELGDPLPDRITGVVFSNEFLDALPVHRVQVVNGEWQEVYVGQASSLPTPATGKLEACPTILAPLSDPRLATHLAGLPIHLMEGYRTEVNLRALDWLADIAHRLERGYVITIDYGHEHAKYFAPHHPDGHLQCYHRHTKNNDPYQHIGDQDITAHVEFTSLIEHGKTFGLAPVTFTDQAHYLLSIGERVITEIVARDAGKLSPERNAIHQLLHSTMGHTFKVLVQRKHNC